MNFIYSLCAVSLPIVLYPVLQKSFSICDEFV